MNKSYSRIHWKNYADTSTPLNESNLNKMDLALDTVDDRVIEHNAEIADIRVDADGKTYASAGASVRGQVSQLSESIVEISDNLIDSVDATIDLTYGTDGYYRKDGVKVSDVGRKYSIVKVESGEEYKLSTTISSTAIAGIIYRNDNSVISYDLVGTGTPDTIVDYPITIPVGCNNIIVQTVNNSKTLALKLTTKVPKNTVGYVVDKDIKLGADILANVGGYYVENTGWSGTKATGYTHEVGYSASVSFSTNAIEEGAIYICDFDTTFTADEFVKVGIGDQYRILVYKGLSHIQIPLLAVGTKTLYFTPLSNVAFTISNVTLRKINGGSDKENLKLFNTLTGNHTRNYGFWNVLLGKNTAENAVGATRTIAIGYASLNDLQGGHRNVGVGTFAMSQMTGGENNVSIGADSMLSVKKANDCIAIGKGTMYNGKLVEDNVAIGHYALTGSPNSENSKRNVAIGKNAGWNSYGQGNTFVGYQAGYRCQNTNGNVCIGNNAYGGASGNHNTCIGESTEFSDGVSNSVALGYGVKADKSNQIKLGGNGITEVVIAGKKINFNVDGTVTWETL